MAGGLLLTVLGLNIEPATIKVCVCVCVCVAGGVCVRPN